MRVGITQQSGLAGERQQRLHHAQSDQLLNGRLDGADLSVVISDAVLVVNRRGPVAVGGRDTGL
jgi:hypothetical protein